MTTKRNLTLWLCLAAAMLLVFNSCKKEEDPINNNNNNNQVKVNPDKPDALSGVLIVNGTVKQGNPPAPSSDSDAPDVDNNQTSASSTVDNTLYLPFTYESEQSLSGGGLGGSYLQVEGARTYWDIPPPSGGAPNAGQLIIPVGIPSNVNIGSFTLLYCVYDNQGRVSNVLQTFVTIAPPGECPASESGSDGLTIFTVDLGGQSGLVTISYETYSVPDRVDVFYNDRWVDGTGSSLSAGQFPPALRCSDATPADGYVGESGTFTLNYNPRDGRSIDVYVSGCIGGGTAWDISVSCPQ